MRHLGIALEVTCNKADILAKLQANREAHQKMVAEARAGYIDAAQKALRERLEEFQKGKAPNLHFALVLPRDFTRVYDTAIGQLSAHTGDTIELSSSEYNMLVEDEWEWVQQFIEANARYSGSTRAWRAEKGFEVE